MANLETRQLGKTGLTVTRLGAGGHFTNGPLAHEDIPRRVQELNHLLDLGVTYFDVQWDPEELATAGVMKSRGEEFTVAWPLHGMNGQSPSEVKQYVQDYCNDHRSQYGIEHVDVLLWVALGLNDDTGPDLVQQAREGFEALKAEGFCDLSLPKSPSGVDSGRRSRNIVCLHGPTCGCEAVRRSFWHATS